MFIEIWLFTYKNFGKSVTHIYNVYVLLINFEPMKKIIFLSVSVILMIFLFSIFSKDSSVQKMNHNQIVKNLTIENDPIYNSELFQ